MAALGETTGGVFLAQVYRKMFSDPVGRKILKERPVITSETVNLDKLRTLAPGTFGREYADTLDRLQITPDSRDAVGELPQFDLLSSSV